MEFVSTRNKENRVGFTGAIRSCHCADGGLYVPASEDNLRPWVYYLKDTTSFSSIAGSLTTAIMKDEFSPLVCEAIATAAFPFSPDFVQLEENLFKLSLFTGPTGSHKDFGVSYLVNCLEYTLLMEEKEAIVFAISDGEIGASLAHAMKGKKHLKALILFPRGTMRGFRQEDCVWNGGNIYPVEVDGSLADCSCLAQRLFARRDLVERYRLTLANTVNIGRLLPQTCFYLYAFSRLKEKVYGDIFYAVAPGNYGNLVAGLYGWQYSLPVNAFVTESTESLGVDASGKAQLEGKAVPFCQREPADPGSPSNLERLEAVFQTQPMVMRGLVFPQQVSSQEREEACRHLFQRYGIYANSETAGAYAAAQKYTNSFTADGSSVVLVARDHPALAGAVGGGPGGREWIREICGQTPEVPESLQWLLEPVVPQKRIDGSLEEVEAILNQLAEEG